MWSRSTCHGSLTFLVGTTQIRYNPIKHCFTRSMESCLIAPPALPNNRIAQLIQSTYPITNVAPNSVRLLGGFDDCNYLLKGKPTGGSCDATNEYIFKVMVENDPDYFDAITKLMRHIEREGIRTSVPIETLSNKDTMFLKKSFLVQKELQDDITYGGLLLNYLPGNILSEIDRSPRLLYDIGTSVGKLSSVLQKFSHPYLEARHFERDLKHFLDLRPYLEFADIAEEKESFETAFRYFSEYVVPKFPQFQTSVLHNDLNADNFVCTTESPCELVGLIDMFDAVCSYSVFDGAIFITYMMMLECTNPLEYSEPAVSGYLSTFPLNEVEFDCLYYLVVCHLTQSTLHALRSQSLFPDNPYRTRTLYESRTTLQRLLSTPKQEVDKMWRAAKRKTIQDF